MKYKVFAAAFCLLFASFAFAQSDEINIIPKPSSVTVDKGKFRLTPKTTIVVKTAEDRQLGAILNDHLRAMYGLTLKITTKLAGSPNQILFRTEGDDRLLPRDGYLLSVESNQIYIQGNSVESQFYGLQSLFQLLPIKAGSVVEIQAVGIHDSPRFGYRGMHLDVARHFMPVEFVKKYIDLMSQYKFNYFHWHLTEDQGWRIEIKKYPRLTEIGSVRKQSRAGRFADKYVGDGTPHGGFYTQEQIRDVVAYAKARYITVIPEIEMPGHSVAALAAYPNLGCKENGSYEVFTDWGITKDIYCPKEETFKFLEDVLTEVIDLFPDSPYIHIGGDEAPKDAWKASQFVQDLKAKEGLKDEGEVQSYFVRRMEKFINSKGKKIIGWDEILEGGLAPNATVMSWRGIKGGIAAAKEHHDVIMTPTDYAYFDYGQGDPATEPLNIGGYLTLEKVYSFDPVPKELSADEAKYIIGGQANIWTEYLPTPASVEYMAFPRMLAMAEDVWSTPENKNFADFSKRLSAQFPRLDKQNVNYRIPEPAGLQNISIENSVVIVLNLTSPLAGGKIYYTTDGTDPTEKSSLCDKGLIFFSLAPKERVDLKTIVVTPTGRKSSIYTATLLRSAMLQPAELTEKRSGVTYAFVTPPASGSSDPTITSGETKTIALQQFAKTADLKQTFGVTFDGYFNAPVDGIYEFQVDSTWGSGVFVAGEKLVDDIGDATRKTRSSVVALRAGLQKISLRYNNRGGDPYFRVRWAIKGQNWRNIGGGELVH